MLTKTEMTLNHPASENNNNSGNKKTLQKFPSLSNGPNVQIPLKKNTSEGMLAIRETSKSPLMKPNEANQKDHASMMDFEDSQLMNRSSVILGLHPSST